MTRKEAFDDFWKTVAGEKCRQAIEQVDGYYRQNKDRLASEFSAAFTAFCSKIRRFQNNGRMEKVAYIYCSMLYTALMQGKPSWRLDAYDHNHFFGSQECAAYFDTPWLFEPLHETCRFLEQARKKYVGKISPGDIDIIKRRQAYRYMFYLEFAARQGLKQAVSTPEFAIVDKEDKIDVRLGEYRDVSDLVYRYDTSLNDSAKTKKWLEQKLDDDSYFGIVATGLDLSGGDFSDIDLRYSRVTESVLKHVNLNGTLLYGADFSQCLIEDSDFSSYWLSGALFDNAEIRRTTFSKSTGSQIDLYDENCEDHMLIDILAGVSFHSGELTDVDISDCYFNKSDFTGAKLKDVSFRWSRMSGAGFQKAVLESCDFNNAILSGAIFDNATISQTNMHSVRCTVPTSDGGNNKSCLPGASFRVCQLTAVDLADCRFEYVDFTGAKLSKASFQGGRLTGANFCDAALTDCDFSDADLSDAEFRNTVFTRCQFDGAKLKGACFYRDTGTSIEVTGLSPEQIKQFAVFRR